MRGHPYYGDPYPDAPDGQGGSCYCGRVQMPTGGPLAASQKDGVS